MMRSRPATRGTRVLTAGREPGPPGRCIHRSGGKSGFRPTATVFRAASIGTACACVLLVFSVVASVRPLYRATVSTEVASSPLATDWPTVFEGEPLIPVELLPIEAKFARGFPGVTAAFTDGHRRLVMRRITQATRMLHPIEGCLRAAGYTVKPAPAWRHPESGLWGVIVASRDGHTLRVRESITSADGSRQWTDVSAWFWSALLHPGDTPWLATIVIEPTAPHPSPHRP